MTVLQVGNKIILGLPAKVPEDNGPLRVTVNKADDFQTPRLPPDFTGLMVATPCYGNTATVDYQGSVLRLALACQAQAIPCEIAIRTGESLVARARNGLVAVFMASTHSHLLFVDADGGFEAPDVLRLLAADKDVIGGVFRLKTEEIHLSLRWLGAKYQSTNIDRTTGAFQVQSVGTGLMLIRKEVFGEIATQNPHLRCAGPMYLSQAEQQQHHAFFDNAVFDGQYCGEDTNFCRLWRDCGGAIWVLPDMQLRHIGVKAYAISLAEHMRRQSET